MSDEFDGTIFMEAYGVEPLWRWEDTDIAWVYGGDRAIRWTATFDLSIVLRNIAVAIGLAAAEQRGRTS